jgi:hypothetical protein
MSMELARKTYATDPEYLIAGVDIGITTAIKEAAEVIEKGAPVARDSNGKVKKITDAADTEGLYGIAADSAQTGEGAVIYLTGEFFGDALALEDGVTADALEIPFRNIGIFLK